MQIDKSELTLSKVVWYCYSKHSSYIYGPFTVKKLYNAHDGKHVILSGQGGDRDVALADDDDFGEIILYDTDPNQPE